MSDEILNDAVDIESVEPVETVETHESTEPVTGREAAERAFDKAVRDAENRVKPTTDESKDEPQESSTEESKEETKPTDEAKSEEEAAPVKGLDAQGKGPNSWKATVREKFKSLPADVQAEVLRRENEHQRLMAESTDARKFASEFINVVQPYDAFLRSNDIHPLQAVSALMNDVYTLKTGSTEAKAKLIATIIQNNGVDIDALNNVLYGNAPQVDEHTAALQRQVQEMQQRLSAQDRQAHEAQSTSINKQITAFASANEFFHDVVGDMQVLLNAGHASSLEDAYEKACRLNPEVFSVLQSRNAQRTAPPAPTIPQVSVQQKVAASSSVKGAPATTRPVAPKKQLTGRDAAMAAWERLEKTGRS